MNMKTMKLNVLGFGFFAMFFIFALSASAQSASFVGNWQSTAPVASMNNAIVKVKILTTSETNVFILINPDNPKKKFVSKYDQATNRLYTTIKNQNVYFAYVSATDMLECYKVIDNTKICDFTRF
jgi:hypothetical protein